MFQMKHELNGALGGSLSLGIPNRHAYVCFSLKLYRNNHDVELGNDKGEHKMGF